MPKIYLTSSTTTIASLENFLRANADSELHVKRKNGSVCLYTKKEGGTGLKERCLPEQIDARRLRARAELIKFVNKQNPNLTKHFKTHVGLGVNEDSPALLGRQVLFALTNSKYHDHFDADTAGLTLVAGSVTKNNLSAPESNLATDSTPRADLGVAHSLDKIQLSVYVDEHEKLQPTQVFTTITQWANGRWGAQNTASRFEQGSNEYKWGANFAKYIGLKNIVIPAGKKTSIQTEFQRTTETFINEVLSDGKLTLDDLHRAFGLYPIDVGLSLIDQPVTIDRSLSMLLVPQFIRKATEFADNVNRKNEREFKKLADEFLRAAELGLRKMELGAWIFTNKSYLSRLPEHQRAAIFELGQIMKELVSEFKNPEGAYQAMIHIAKKAFDNPHVTAQAIHQKIQDETEENGKRRVARARLVASKGKQRTIFKKPAAPVEA